MGKARSDIVLSKRAQRDFEALPDVDRVAVQAALTLLAIGSPTCNVKKLQGRKGEYRLRVGDLRVIFEREVGAVLSWCFALSTVRTRIGSEVANEREFSVLVRHARKMLQTGDGFSILIRGMSLIDDTLPDVIEAYSAVRYKHLEEFLHPSLIQKSWIANALGAISHGEHACIRAINTLRNHVAASTRRRRYSSRRRGYRQNV